MTEDAFFQLRTIAAHYGKAQVGKAVEELGELVAAITRYQASPSDLHWDGLIGEIADVYNMLDQLILVLGCGAAVTCAREAKIQRQIARIRMEKMQ